MADVIAEALEIVPTPFLADLWGAPPMGAVSRDNGVIYMHKLLHKKSTVQLACVGFSRGFMA